MPITDALLQQILTTMQAQHAKSDPIAAAASAIIIWEQLTLKFAPMIGPRSVDLMCMRSLELNKSAFPWLALASLPSVEKTFFASLKVSFEQRQPAEIIAANCALVASFITLLATLIGASLTAQFLGSVFPGNAPPQKP